MTGKRALQTLLLLLSSADKKAAALPSPPAVDVQQEHGTKQCSAQPPLGSSWPCRVNCVFLGELMSLPFATRAQSQHGQQTLLKAGPTTG